MHPLLETIFETRKFINSQNIPVDVHSETSKKQCAFLQEIIYKNGFKKSVEIGLAFGTSTLAIGEAIVNNGGRFMAIDKFQTEFWGGNGVDLIKQAGYTSQFEFVEDFSYNTLPTLLKEGRTFDFAYIDTTKLFDFLMVDFFFLDKLIALNGIIVFDDVVFPGIRKLLRYISQLPHYKIYAQEPQNSQVKKEPKLARLIKKYAGDKDILKEELIKTDYELGVNSHCIALQKIDADKRNYDWHVTF